LTLLIQEFILKSFTLPMVSGRGFRAPDQEWAELFDNEGREKSALGSGRKWGGVCGCFWWTKEELVECGVDPERVKLCMRSGEL
jgi:hypothetical protein